MSLNECFSYISTKAGADPVRLVFLCASARACPTASAAEEFARSSGWLDAVERAGAALVAPSAANGWPEGPNDLLHMLYSEARGAFSVAKGRGIPGKNDVAWLWEVLIGLVGYGDGATFVADYVAAHPSFAAASVIVDGDLSASAALDNPSDHWFVTRPSEGYRVPANRDVPVASWLVGSAGKGVAAESFCLRDAPEGCMRVDYADISSEPVFAERALDYLSHVVRWKSCPDGRLVWHHTKEDFLLGGAYRHRAVKLRGVEYPYAVYLPCGMPEKEARGLPLVLSIHGRGEPAWIFSDKNGWERLADETRAFAVVLPDSPGNVWIDGRDDGAAGAIAKDAVRAFGFDASRVYITGFSNGAVYACQQATAHPECFSAVSAWNGPCLDAVLAGGLGDHVFAEGFSEGDAEMPFWICQGSADGEMCRGHEADLAYVLAPNGCDEGDAVCWDGENHYLPELGYVEGERLESRVYLGSDGLPRVGITEVRDLPHGAIEDEARAAWEFMSGFSRAADSKKVEVRES